MGVEPVTAADGVNRERRLNPQLLATVDEVIE
jgi:hypothetical protein